jgi:hypothetical protein
MHSYEVPREKWPTEITSFGEAHHHWLVSVEVLGEEVGAQPEVRDLPLEGLSAEPANKGGSVSIFVVHGGARDMEHLTRLITSPTRIFIEEEDHGAAMEIESADGTNTVVTFTHPEK